MAAWAYMVRGERVKRTSPEQSLHRAVAQYLDLALPPEYRWSTFPAGGGGRVRGAMLKAAGLKAGWPDILVLERYGDGWFGIELKGPRGEESPEQVEFREWAGAGTVAVCRSVEEVEVVLRSYHIPLRARARR